MTVQTVRDVEQIRPITYATDARDVALGVHAKLVRFLEQLEPEEWSAPTDCPAWDVADMVGHLIGAGRANASIRQLLRQQIWAARHKGEFGGNDLDAMNALQVRDHAGLTPAQRVAALRAITTAAVKGRMRFPRPLRGVRIPLAPSGSTAQGMPTSLTLGHLMEVIYTRDAWLHRVDIARATGRALDLDHIDARVVEDVVAEWARRHGQPFHLTLTGPAGGEFRQVDGGPRIELDAVEFCRALSGRAPAEGLLATRVLF
jgi:uncharacterized protein (TIGR03083 family)